jgi:tRNA-dihydrouridine synthase B
MMTQADKFWMAPLHGITDHTFRTLYSKHIAKLDFAIAPFVSVTSGIKEKTERFRDFFPENNQLLPIEPQIMANKTEQLLLASTKLEEIGYSCFNWNMGCPAKQVSKHGRGAGLLKDVPKIDEMLSEFFIKSKNEMSVKIRLGYSNTNDLEHIIETLNKFPLKYVCVHPRLATQMYDGSVLLDTFDLVVKNLNHKIIYSGDITNLHFFNELKKRYPQINNWMIGRGLLSKITVMNEIDKTNPMITPSLFWEFYQDLRNSYLAKFNHEKVILGRLKEIWSYFVQNEMLNSIPIHLIMRSQSLEEMDRVLRIS